MCLFVCGSGGMGQAVVLILWVLVWATGDAVEDAETHFVFNGFGNSGADVAAVKLIGGASVVGSALRLTNRSLDNVGRAIYRKPLSLKSPENGSLVSFSTTFVFCMEAAENGAGPGMAFLFTPFNSSTGATTRRYLGLLNQSTEGQDSNHLLAVEFDTSKSLPFNDIDENHVGVDVNSLVSVTATHAGYWENNKFYNLTLNDGGDIQAWIEYNSKLNTLDITVAPFGKNRPVRPLIRSNVPLSRILVQHMYAGFSSATGGRCIETHFVYAWSLATHGVSAPQLDLSAVRRGVCRKESKTTVTGKTYFKVLVSVGSLMAVAATLGGLGWVYYRRRRKEKAEDDEVEEWEYEFWPHRFAYKDLHKATNGFDEHRIIGSGGFGQVYKGTLMGVDMAIKCVRPESTQGMKEFVAEVTSLGSLRHRNLVQLKGWCRRKTKLFIVYDYMPNGSLDKLTKSPKEFSWEIRVSILRDLAAGVMYLHEGWEQTVVHRDIKCSNVLLDKDMRAALGDFGLARLYERDGNDRNDDMETTRVVGTPGYIAPELVSSVRPTTRSDIYSLGVVVMVVACGRAPVEKSRPDEEVLLLEWIDDLRARGSILDAADPSLAGKYDSQQMLAVLSLGMRCWCCDYDPESRPSIKDIVLAFQTQPPPPCPAMEL